MKQKLTSRKFWLCAAAFLSSIAASVSGIQTGNSTLTTVGLVSGVVASAIYAMCEAWVDAARNNKEESDGE